MSSRALEAEEQHQQHVVGLPHWSPAQAPAPPAPPAPTQAPPAPAPAPSVEQAALLWKGEKS